VQGVQGPRAVRAARASLAGGVRRRVGGMCSCEVVCGHGEGVARRETRAACVCRLRPSGTASRAWGNPLCVCVCVCAPHSPAQAVGVWVQLVRRLRGRRASPHATRRGRRWTTACAAPCACDRRAGGASGGAPWSQREMRRRSHKFADAGALPADETSRSSRAKPDGGRPDGEPEGVRLGWGPSPSCGRVCRAARPVKKKGGRPKGTDTGFWWWPAPLLDLFFLR